jgi:hypothetical protein
MGRFREAMGKLAGQIDNEGIELLQSIGQLDQCVAAEARVRVDSEAQMAKLLEVDGILLFLLHTSVLRSEGSRGARQAD